MTFVPMSLASCVLQPSKYKLIEPTMVEDLVKHYPGEFDLITDEPFAFKCPTSMPYDSPRRE